ncbi:MAG: YhgE/Pip domain-containing protein [bacterium]|nr:YhgE/Pip domain-containing protein [bacterium]
MKAIWKIYTKDISTIFKNYAACIVILALCILPSLYAWFNIKASWDPYGKSATSGIKVGVVNEDQGASLNGKEINIGDTVVDELKKNTQLGWQFISKEQAENELENENIYAYITIPSEFSANLTSIVGAEIKKGTIRYTVNEKMNAIAPKLTDKGVTSLQQTLSETVVETVSDTILKVGKEVGADLENQIPNITEAYNKLVEIQSHFTEINQTVKEGETSLVKIKTLLADVNDKLPKITSLLTTSTGLASNLQTFLTTAKQSSDQIAPVIETELTTMKAYSDGITDKLSALSASGSLSSEQMMSEIKTVSTQANYLKSDVDTLLPLLTRLNNLSTKNPFAEQIKRLETASEKLATLTATLDDIYSRMETGEINVLEALNRAITTQQAISNALDKVREGLSGSVKSKLDQIFFQSYSAAEGAVTLFKDAEAKLPQVSEALKKASKGIKKGEKGITFANEALPKAETLIDTLVEKMKAVNDKNGLEELVNLLKVDVTKRSDFLSNPVTIEEEKIYPIANYGTGMTPFYTVLSLWVGILLLLSILTVDAHGEYRPYQVYIGKLMLFGTIAMIQALIVSLGDLYLLKITCKHPVVFVAVNLLTGLSFAIIVYGLVSVLGNVGKVIGIILLVLQVAGSGGTFPVQLTPVFFQRLNPFLPFTYCISLNREAVGGIVRDILVKDMVVIAIYVIAFILFALFLKGPINNLLKGFVRRFHESGLGE